ncbi:Predicted arabinose efflux permease, MFS family [Andreprevotia lacus DSM 23236]|jgi:predicted MFS family arabinose efflux permease|uniref:Predicted arabinose efflux permease, MFS family n=1 Tax=Andreprevotia lacus DSM 23236 TaxID=1121001 RepID=A0A1W1XPU7_9NEIS|nr:MFS transporter [Andreprevotia lacus]SMC25897.1 Predicted arabinose efflux permease, MFS family [Andreprevotia lacus DSM 23236]
MSLPNPRQIIALIAALQFVYILDFMMVMPLGPDLAKALGFDGEHLGWLTAAYALASGAAGLAGSRYLDRFDRRKALLWGLGIFALATLAGSLSTNLPMLLLARALTGLAGGPAIAVAMAIVIDVTLVQARGAAIGKVMIGFSLAAILGVPLSLQLAGLWGWQAPFVLVGAAAVLVWCWAATALPALRGHMNHGPAISLSTLLRKPAVRHAYVLQALAQFSAFLIIPLFPLFLLGSAGIARDQLGMLYLIGGCCAFVTLQLLGRLADRTGPRLPAIIATLALCAGLLPMVGIAGGAVIGLFAAFMAGNAGRNITLSTICSAAPSPQERAGFMALQSIVQDLAIAAASYTSSLLLIQREGLPPDFRPVALLAIGMSLCLFGLMALNRRTSPQTAESTSAP